MSRLGPAFIGNDVRKSQFASSKEESPFLHYVPLFLIFLWDSMCTHVPRSLYPFVLSTIATVR